MSALQPHQQRVVDECNELTIKTAKLGMFFGSPSFKTIDAAEQARLNKQWLIMQQLIDVLQERIEAFQ